LIGLVTSFLGFLILPLIPLKSDVEKYQLQREEARALRRKALKSGDDAESAVRKEVKKLEGRSIPE
jgi:hypothetical protein